MKENIFDTLLMFVIVVIITLNIIAYIIDWRAGLLMTIAFGIDKYISRKLDKPISPKE